MNILVGTQSALKLRAVRQALQVIQLDANIQSVEVKSGVRAQPVGHQEIMRGARNRARQAAEQNMETDLCCGIEDGIVCIDETWFAVSCVCILHPHDNRNSIAFGPLFPIPTWMAEKTLIEDSELGALAQLIAGGGEKDATRLLSGGKMKREDLIAIAVQCALVCLET